MLHQNSSGNGRSRRLGKGLFQFVAVARSGSKDCHYVNRSCALGGVVQPHSFGELWPGWAIDERVPMPGVQVTRAGGGWRAGGFYRSARSEMLDHRVVPVLAALMPQHDVMSGHRRSGVWFLKVLGFLNGFSQSGF